MTSERGILWGDIRSGPGYAIPQSREKSSVKRVRAFEFLPYPMDDENASHRTLPHLRRPSYTGNPSCSPNRFSRADVIA